MWRGRDPCSLVLATLAVLRTNLWRTCCTLALPSVHFQTAPWNVSEILCPSGKLDLSAPCQTKGSSHQSLPASIQIMFSVCFKLWSATDKNLHRLSRLRQTMSSVYLCTFKCLPVNITSTGGLHYEKKGNQTGSFDQLYGVMQEFELCRGGLRWDSDARSSIHPNTHMESISYSPSTVNEPGRDLLDLLGVFVADEHDDGINVNTVEPLDGVRRDVEQTVAALHPNTDNRTSV